jgi:Electron transfer flavoprotein domain
MLPATRCSALRAVRSSTQVSCRRTYNSSLARLLSTLAILEQRDGKLNSGSLCAVTAAKRLGGSVTGFIAGSNIKNVAEQAAKGNGMGKVVMVENGAYDRVRKTRNETDVLLPRILIFIRDFPRTSPRFWLRTSSKEDTPISLRATQPLGRVCCREWLRSWMCSRFQMSCL